MGSEREARWPASRHEKRAWRQVVRGGTREDQMLGEIAVSIPPSIADCHVPIDASLAAVVESAMSEITALDSSHGAVLDGLEVLLMRAESVASSKIERVQASLDEYARALHGTRSNPSAVSMVAATNALAVMVDRVGITRRIDLTTLTDAHRALMIDEPDERDYAGRLRDMQNWVGGSDHSPRSALYIPPPPELVGASMDDLVRFSGRQDMPALVQASLAHAQFESIHPFTDGNGRIGRALINAVLRRRGSTTRVVVPVASALVAHRDRYFDLLDTYRDGDPRPIIEAFAVACRLAASESRVTASRLADIPNEWQDMVGATRRDSTAAKLLLLLLGRPILSADEARELTGASESRAYAAIERLYAAGVLRPLTDRKRNQVWGAGLVLDELDDLGVRIARAAR
jgi:Fic family protein